MNGPDFQSGLMSTSRCVIVTDARESDHPIIFANHAFTATTGYSLKETLGRNCRFLQGPNTNRETVADIRDALSGRHSIRREILNYKKNGEAFWNDLTIDPVTDRTGRVIQFIGIQHDATDRHTALAQHQEADQRLANIINNVPGYVFQRIMQPDGTLSYPYFSPSIFRILGLPEGTDWRSGESVQFLHPDERDHLLRGIIQSGTDLTRLLSEFRFVSPAGEEHWFRTDSTPRVLTNGDVVWDGLAIDISSQKSSETRLAHLTHHDELTGLANRVFFRASLLKAMTTVLPEKCQCALIYIDLEDFEAINHSNGQWFGDRVLRRIGLVLKEFAEARGGTAGRLGGDEFALLLPTLSVDSVPAVAEAICRELAHPILIDGREVVVLACAGATGFYPVAEVDESSSHTACVELMNRASLALQAAKRSGPGVACLYSVALDDQFRDKVALRNSLQNAITAEQFELHYQPLVDLASGEIVGAEALVRWNHPEFGIQRPDAFIPFAETSGLIVPLGAWTFKTAMKQSQLWRRQGIPTPRIAINLSSIQLQRSDFIVSIEQALAETGASPSDFEFELTEGTLIKSSPDMHSRLNALKSLGFDLALDDFGTGHSTFKYLREFSVDKIKIDQSFVRQLVVDSNDASIIRAMIALSRSLRLKVVAEGIETLMQRNFLHTEGCAIGQGYFFSPPMSVEDFSWMLKQRIRLPLAATSSHNEG